MKHPTHHIFEFMPDTLADWCVERGMPRFRAKQILEWVYEKGVVDPAQMTNLSAKDRELLAEQMTFLSGPTVAHQLATDGTQKLLIEWPDDIETSKVD
ncbi:MAG: 23S rRNA (adenine(2503)-C(2))-methyltransferase RlmN, partial [Phycisphaerales bacterium]